MKIRRVDKIRILVLLPLSLAFLVVGSIFLSQTGKDDKQSILPGIENTSDLLSTEVQDLLAQAPEPPSPTPIPTTVPEPPSPTPIPTDIPALSCKSNFSYTGSGSELTYVLSVKTTSATNQTSMNIDLRPYLANNNIQIVEYSGNCSPTSNDGLFKCNQLSGPALVFFKVVNEFTGTLDFGVEVEKKLLNNDLEAASCDASLNIAGINTPPPGLPPYSPQPSTPLGGNEVECNPYKEYCSDPGKNLIDDIDFNQSHDGSFENPVCTLKLGGSLNGECGSLDRATYYEADISIQIPMKSEPFFNPDKTRPEYIRQVVVGEICEEKLQSHGNHSFKIFSPSVANEGIDAGLCIPIDDHTKALYTGINFRTTQNKKTGDPTNPDSNPDNFSSVTFRLGYYKERPLANVNIFGGVMPPISSGQITWIDSELIEPDDYEGEGAAYRIAGGFLSGNFPKEATGLCFKAEAAEGISVSTFWDAAFATEDEGICEDATNHSDGIDRSCGGFECGNNEPVLSGSNYTDFTQENYAFDMPANWNAKQCEYKTETNGASSPYGTLFAGLDLNSCDPNYSINNQREINPEFNCAEMRNWTYGFAWTGGVKDFGLLQFLDCSLKKIDESKDILEDGNALKGTDSSPFFCDSILKSYSNSKNIAGIEDPAFTVRYTNTYSGLVNAIQAEGENNYWKVPLLGSAVANRIINNRQDESLRIDPFLIGRRNSGSGMNNAQKFNLEDFVVSKVIRTEEHLFESSIIPNTEVLISDLLANRPVCRNIEGDPITKIHYGSTSGESDRAIFGFADDEGSFEHIVEASNEEITPEQLCDYQFLDNRVVGAECTILDIGDGEDVTFTEGNIGASLESQGLVGRLTAPTLPAPTPPGIPDPNFETCPPVNLCGQDFTCSNSMRDLYNACRANRPEFNIDEIGGNPFIRWERPSGWKDLEIAGLNKVLESGWQNEFIHYNQVVRHENVGLDVNQVVSVYDQQQPKCSWVPGASYCTPNSVVNKAAQVCRRVEPYNCNCQPSNYSTCLLACKQMFVKPQDVPNIGLQIEGTVIPTVPKGTPQPLDNAIRPILENTHTSFLERFVSILSKREGEYDLGEVYKYDPRYTGGFLLANTSETNVSQCSATNAGATSVSQVRLENYYAYGGQLARINERVGFAATNNKDGKTSDQLIIDPDAAIGEIQDFILRGGESYDHIALPYCDLLTEAERSACSTNTNESCDCLVRTCEQKYNDQVTILDKYLPLLCERIREINLDDNPGNNIPISTEATACKTQLRDHWINQRFKPEYEQCEATPKNNLNFNCDPMANYIMDQGFDTPELRLAACDDIINSSSSDGEGNLECVEGGIYGLIQAVADGLNAVQPQITAEAIYAIGVHEGFGNGLSGDPNEIAQTNPTIGTNDLNNDNQISPPCTESVINNCEWDVRGVMQFRNFTFHTVTTRNFDLMKSCTDAIGVNYDFSGPIDEGMLAMFGGDMAAYEAFPFSRNRVGDNICAAAIFVSDLGQSERGDRVPPDQWEQAARTFTSNDGSNLIYRVAGRYLGVDNYDTCTRNTTSYQYCNQVAESMRSVYERGTFENISGEECSNFTGYAGTCEEIFNQVKQEPAYSAISTAIYSEEVSPYYDDTFAALNPGSHMCSMTMFGTNQTMYCFEKGDNGEQVPLSVCQDCPVRATALFRHELNHAISPITSNVAATALQRRMLSEFSADAVSNNGGWYMFNYQGNWMFATQIVSRLSASYGIPTETITQFLNGKIANPGINFLSELLGVCHYSGSDAIGVDQCPTKQIPPGLENSNCNNVGTGLPGNVPEPIKLGVSTGGRDINAYKFGTGPNKILFVGGVHGGYEWNSILLAYEAIEYFAKNSEAVPNTATLYIIPSANPDGQARAGLGVGPIRPGNYPRSIANRYNDNGVDINRNFDCAWTPNPSDISGNELTGKGGTAPFSENESKILRDFIRSNDPKASIFWHSAGNFISPAGCGDLLYPPSIELSNTYGGYRVITQEEIDENNGSAFSYAVTGDVTNWMETEGYSGTTIELQSGNRSEFERNISGMLKVLQKYGKSTPVPSGPQPI